MVLEITKQTPTSKGTTVPVTAETLAPFLRDTQYVKPSDPAIRQRLAAIRGDEKEAFTIAQNILKWISENISPTLTAETLTGPEVLKKRSGKCSEYATLFASLARAAGIPTRLALGVAYTGNVWVGHMWNEVWLGEWVAVDPSASVFIAGPSHVKFVHSPTVKGTQRVRMRLVDNLSLEILDFTEEEELLPITLKEGIENNTYTSVDFACRISAPDDTWEMTEKKGLAKATVTMKPKDEKMITAALVLIALPPGTSGRTVLNIRMSSLPGMLKNFKKVGDGEIEIGQEKVPRVVFQHDTRGGVTLVNENYLLVKGVNGYLFAFIAPKGRFEELKLSFEKILESFELLR